MEQWQHGMEQWQQGFPTGVLQRRHYLNCDITRLAKCPPEKQTN